MRTPSPSDLPDDVSWVLPGPVPDLRRAEDMSTTFAFHKWAARKWLPALQTPLWGVQGSAQGACDWKQRVSPGIRLAPNKGWNPACKKSRCVQAPCSWASMFWADV